MTPSRAVSTTRWARAHPVAVSAVMFVGMFPIGLLIFWDYRGALAGSVYSAALTYLWVRPGGFGYRIEAHQERERAARGDMQVRIGWVIRSALGVLLAMVLAAVLIAVVAQAM